MTAEAKWGLLTIDDLCRQETILATCLNATALVQKYTVQPEPASSNIPQYHQECADATVTSSDFDQFVLISWLALEEIQWAQTARHTHADAKTVSATSSMLVLFFQRAVREQHVPIPCPRSSVRPFQLSFEIYAYMGVLLRMWMAKTTIAALVVCYHQVSCYMRG